MGIGYVSRSIFLCLLLVMVISKLCLIHSFIYCYSSCSCYFDKYTSKKHAKLGECEMKPIKGESKLCATSLESMLDFVNEIFGFNSQFQVLSTTHFTESTTLLQNYTILKKPEEISAPKMVAGHTMPYPYAIFYCHYQESESKAFKVLLGGDNGDRVEAAAVCHLDTSEWSPDHVSFRVLGIEPGFKPVCHFFPADNLVWFAS